MASYMEIDAISSVSDHISTVSTAQACSIISVLRNLSSRIYMRIAALKMHNRSTLWMFNPRMNINHRGASFAGNRWKSFWTDVRIDRRLNAQWYDNKLFAVSR